jgi:hypothetical protein
MCQDSLAYVIGFLRELVRAEAPAGIVISACIDDVRRLRGEARKCEPERMKELYNLSGNFITGLIQEEKTS